MLSMTNEQFAEAIMAIPKFRRFEAIGNDDAIKVRCLRDRDDETVFVLNKGKSRYGRRLTMTSFLYSYTPVLLSKDEETAKWRKKLATIEKRLEASGLWEDIKEIAHNLQSMTKEEYDTYTDALNGIRECGYKYSSVSEEEKRVLLPKYEETAKAIQTKYPFLLREDGSIYYSYDADWIHTLKTKSMNFGYNHKRISEEIKRHLTEHTSFSDRGYTSYDVSYQYDADKNMAWYSEEYRGCGNGHYYLALDATMALFYEDD